MFLLSQGRKAAVRRSAGPGAGSARRRGSRISMQGQSNPDI
jgi:hypothetical protein